MKKLRRVNRKRYIVLDQIKFQCNEDEDDDDNGSGNDEESWVCVEKDCTGEIVVNGEEILADKSTSHTCQPCLKLSQLNRGYIDGYYFEKQDNDVWKCENCECKIRTRTNENSLQYPHSDKMHQCISLS